MTFSLRRTSGEELELTEQHELLVLPRKGKIDWDAFDRSAYAEADLARALDAWKARVFTEMHSLTLFTQLSSQIHKLGAPLDWSGAFARMIADEVRHTDQALRMCEALGERPDVKFEEENLHLDTNGPTLRAHVRTTVIAAFCISETLSGRMFKRCLRAATVPLAREVVAAVLVDETFHAELGWELGALLMRPSESGFEEERALLVASLPGLYAHFARQCCARVEDHVGTSVREWAMTSPDKDPGENFGTLSDAGYARAYFEGMEEDVVPGLVAIGLPEAQGAWQEFVAKLDAPAA